MDRYPDKHGIMTHSLGKKIGIASLIMMMSVFLSRIIGLFRDMVIAHFAGIDASVDAYVTAFMIPEIFNHILASGFLSVTFIPIFSGYLSRNRESDGWRIFNIVLNSSGVFLVLLILIGMIFTPDLVNIAAGGRDDPEFRSQVVRMTRIIIPAQLFHLTGGLFMAVQFAKERFLIPALSPLVYNLGIIIGGFVLGPSLGMESFCWGVLAGAFAGPFLLQMWGAARAGLSYKLNFGFNHPDFVKYLKLTLPLMVGLSMMFSLEILFKYFGNYLSEGNISALNYSKIIMLIPVGLFGQAVGQASYPFMARLAVEHHMSEINRLINKVLRYISLVIPFSVVLILVRHELVQVLFERGKFNAEATTLTADILVFMLPGAFALSAYTVVARGYYATQNTLYPAVFGSVAVLCSLPVYWYGMKLMGAPGIGLAVSISVIFQVILLYILWNRRTGNSESRTVFHLYGKIIGISVILAIPTEWVRRWFFTGLEKPGFAEALGICCLIGGVYSFLFLGSGYLLKIEEIKTYVKRLMRRV